MDPARVLIMLVGFPRSGKTTWAMDQGCPIVNPDAIRLALHGHAFIGDAEPMVWAIARYMVKALFLAGHEKVILDACNNTRKRRDPWASEEWIREFVVFATPAAKCEGRVNLEEENARGLLEAIRRMAEQHEPIEDDEGEVMMVTP